jgi:hypothetical protein
VNQGASNVFFRVFTLRRGRLYRLPSPPHSSGWEVGGSVGTGTQIFGCRRGALIALDATPTRASHRYGQAAYTYVLTRTTYRWASGHWQIAHRQQHAGAGPGTPLPRCPGAGYF